MLKVCYRFYISSFMRVDAFELILVVKQPNQISIFIKVLFFIDFNNGLFLFCNF